MKEDSFLCFSLRFFSVSSSFFSSFFFGVLRFHTPCLASAAASKCCCTILLFILRFRSGRLAFIAWHAPYANLDKSLMNERDEVRRAALQLSHSTTSIPKGPPAGAFSTQSKTCSRKTLIEWNIKASSKRWNTFSACRAANVEILTRSIAFVRFASCWGVPRAKYIFSGFSVCRRRLMFAYQAKGYKWTASSENYKINKFAPP